MGVLAHLDHFLVHFGATLVQPAFSPVSRTRGGSGALLWHTLMIRRPSIDDGRL